MKVRAWRNLLGDETKRRLPTHARRPSIAEVFVDLTRDHIQVQSGRALTRCRCVAWLLATYFDGYSSRMARR